MDGQSELPASDSDEVRSVILVADVPVDRVKVVLKTGLFLLSFSKTEFEEKEAQVIK